ncbi:hypothetical protein MNV49_007495 [Pseudohyphozyma bogoriensis]|nr:hypothetical protein MNV49_007495 [Pseudohyphozyma bogoriensis]
MSITLRMSAPPTYEYAISPTTTTSHIILPIPPKMILPIEETTAQAASGPTQTTLWISAPVFSVIMAAIALLTMLTSIFTPLDVLLLSFFSCSLLNLLAVVLLFVSYLRIENFNINTLTKPKKAGKSLYLTLTMDAIAIVSLFKIVSTDSWGEYAESIWGWFIATDSTSLTWAKRLIASSVTILALLQSTGAILEAMEGIIDPIDDANEDHCLKMMEDKMKGKYWKEVEAYGSGFERRNAVLDLGISAEMRRQLSTLE